MQPGLILFGALAGISAVSAIGVIAFRDAVRSALCLVANFFTLAFLYFTLNAELLGIIQIVVYTGAIMVLFLFVLMLLAAGGSNLLTESRDVKRILGGGFGAALLLIVASQVAIPFKSLTEPQAANVGAPSDLGRALFTHYAWPFEVASVLLLIGIVGSILLAKEDMREVLSRRPQVASSRPWAEWGGKA